MACLFLIVGAMAPAGALGVRYTFPWLFRRWHTIANETRLFSTLISQATNQQTAWWARVLTVLSQNADNTMSCGSTEGNVDALHVAHKSANQSAPNQSQREEQFQHD